MTTCKFTYTEDDSRLGSGLPAVVCHKPSNGSLFPAGGNEMWKKLATKNSDRVSGMPHFKAFLEKAEERLNSIEHRNELRDLPSTVEINGRDECMYCWGGTSGKDVQDTSHEKDHMLWCVLLGGTSDIGGTEEYRAENLAKYIASPEEHGGVCDFDDKSSDSNCNRSVNKSFSCTASFN